MPFILIEGLPFKHSMFLRYRIQFVLTSPSQTIKYKLIKWEMIENQTFLVCVLGIPYLLKIRTFPLTGNSLSSLKQDKYIKIHCKILGPNIYLYMRISGAWARILHYSVEKTLNHSYVRYRLVRPAVRLQSPLCLSAYLNLWFHLNYPDDFT